MKYRRICVALAACTALAGTSSVQATDTRLNENRATGSACKLMVKRADQFTLIDLPDFDPSILSIPLLPPNTAENASAVICQRTTIVPLPHDYRVLTEMHLPLALRTDRTTLWLMIESGQLKVQFKDGQATPDEMRALQERLDEMQSALQSVHQNS
jgi:hypothetical protein